MPLCVPRMAKHDYIFVDESGDVGYGHDPNSGKLTSSNFYIAAALHLTDDAFGELNRHVAAFRFYSGLSRELKIPQSQEAFGKLLDPIRVMSEAGKNIWASVVYLDKLKYTGSYLKPGGTRPADSVKFRNYVLRRLLEHHFKTYELKSEQYDLVLDRVEMTREQIENLREYLGANRHFRTPTYITHASSIYVEGLQVVHHIANGYGSIIANEYVPSALSFVNARDITTNQRIFGNENAG